MEENRKPQRGKLICYWFTKEGYLSTHTGYGLTLNRPLV